MKLKSFILAIILGVFLHALGYAQAEKQLDAAEILHQIEKLQVVGSALYIAAHPDDENTRLISYLSNEEKVQTAYLSLTRGDGGQNLIGPELGPALGVIRTQELLSARDIDGGQQFFTRAIDFGYSKSPEETLNFWDKQKVLKDMVWVIRKFRPDVMINRFNHRTTRSTHGHHTASAMLSVEAFDLAGDPTAFPEQLEYVDVWQPKRLFFNTSWWFYGSREKFREADKSALTSVDVGVYYPLLGYSNNEIAAMARSQHRCQGFGTDLDRGEQSEYLELIKGDWNKEEKGIFRPINLGWSRLKGGESIGQMLKIIEENFDPQEPAQSIPLLLQARRDINNIENDYWKNIKLKEVDQIIKACAGLYFEAVTDQPTAIPGEGIEFSVEAIARQPIPVALFLNQISVNETSLDTAMALKLAQFSNYNEDQRIYFRTDIPKEIKYSTPFWLRKPWDQAMYTVEDPHHWGQAENKPSLTVDIKVHFGDQEITYTEPIKYKTIDPAIGEIYSPFAITPPVFLNFDEEVNVFAEMKGKEISVKVQSMTDSLNGILSLNSPDGWEITPKEIEVKLNNKFESEHYQFELTPTKRAVDGNLRALFTNKNGRFYNLSVTEIDYDHIPKQYVMLPAHSKIVNIEMEKAGQKIGYIMGAGDAIPSNLEQVGYEVSLLEEEDCAIEHLQKYDAIVLGIRAYNTLDWLVRKQDLLFKFVKEGGTLITQYNTSYRIKTEKVAPLPLQISRDRVTDETAKVQILSPDHPVMNYPNKIEEEDFQNWVQERGLYFADEWADEFTPILSSHDPDEPDRKGGLLIAPYGKGHYVYTGYSWFRQLPAGVPGAYRLFANILALGNQVEQ
jgi:LmbE family N-acetylglucosaminyl deacetylase